MEIAVTATLVSVILGTASSAQNVGTIGPLEVGGYIALAGLSTAPVSGTSMNPAPFLRGPPSSAATGGLTGCTSPGH